MSRRVLLAISPSGLFCASANSRWSNDRLLMRYHTARLAEWDLVGSLHQHRYSLYIKPHVQTIVYRHGYHNNHLRRLTVTELQELKTTKRELLMQLYDASSEPNIVTTDRINHMKSKDKRGLSLVLLLLLLYQPVWALSGKLTTPSSGQFIESPTAVYLDRLSTL